MQEEVLKKLSKFTKHKHVRITDRGNSAIFVAMAMVKKLNPKPFILIPDQGGWISFRTYPRLLDFDIKEIRTDKGILNLKTLKEGTKNASALIMTSFAGYFADQPLKKIAKICKKNDCLLIEDASGAIGDKSLCDGKRSDIIVGSFGRWKPVNLGYGGFISVRERNFFDQAKEAFSMIKVHNNIYDELYPLLNTKRLKALFDLQKKVKEELKSKNIKIFHEAKRGLNVVTEYSSEVLKYCAEKKYQYVLCPTYIRLNEKAVSIELKRLDL
ncbi:MAG: DegT/DnrJ/EryC1/StrS family aminotransferase [Nanoarchaeota archaeon]|nr:DegT/DnrJ/EryC1/StrS family aminotransferase [Nanoarchaeota archaeon]